MKKRLGEGLKKESRKLKVERSEINKENTDKVILCSCYKKVTTK